MARTAARARQTPYSRQLLGQVQAQRAAVLTTEGHAALGLRGAFASVQARVGAPLQAVVSAYGDALSAAQAAQKTLVGRGALRGHTDIAHASQRLQATAREALGAFASAAAGHIEQGQRQVVSQASHDAQANILLGAGHHAHQAQAAGAVKAARQKALDALIGRSQRGGRLGDLLARLGKASADRLLERLMQALDTGMGPRTLASWLMRDLNLALSQALMIARSELLGAYRDAALQNYQANGDVVKGWVWLAELGSACAACTAMHGTEHSLDETLDSHVNCFPAGVLVSGPRPVGSTTRWYEGEIVQIKTGRGYVLTVTPNHPILTSHGWVAAGELVEGGDVISRSGGELGHPMAITEPDDYQIEAPIEQVAETLPGASDMRAIRMPTAAEDFHGDGGGSQVHVVRAYRHLGDSLDAALAEQLSQGDLCWRHMRLALLSGLGAPLQPFQRVTPAPTGGLSGLGVAPVLVGSAAGRQQAISRSAVASGNVLLTQPAINDSAAYPVPSRQSIDRFAGCVAPDEIIHVNRMAFHGYVYNLQTTEQWYVANNIITHNCRCAMAPLTAGWDDILGPLGIDTSDIPDTRLSVQSGGAWFNQQDAGTQRSILGPAKYAAYKAGDLDLEDLLGEGDDGIFEKTLKSLGLNAQDYLGS